PARKEVEVRHAVTLVQWLAHRIGADAGAEPLDPSAHLVTEREVTRQRAVDVFHLAAPDVQIGAANPGTGQSHQDGARLDVRNGIFAQLELATVGLEHCDSTRHARPPPSSGDPPSDGTANRWRRNTAPRGRKS